jgi:hypothetical protein
MWNRVWSDMRGRVWNIWCGIVYGVICEVVYGTGGVEYTTSHPTPKHHSTPPVPYTTSHLTPYTIPHHLFRTRPRISPICTIRHHLFHARLRISPHARYDTTCSIQEQVVSNRVWGEMRGRVRNRWCRIVYGVRCEVVYGTGGVESCMGLRCEIVYGIDGVESCMEQVVSNRVWGWGARSSHPIHDSTRPVPYMTSHLTPYTIPHHLFHTRPRISPHARYDTTCSIHDLASHPYTIPHHLLTCIF